MPGCVRSLTVGKVFFRDAPANLSRSRWPLANTGAPNGVCSRGALTATVRATGGVAGERFNATLEAASVRCAHYFLPGPQKHSFATGGSAARGLAKSRAEES